MLDKQSRISSTVRVADAPPRRQAPPADPCAMVVFGASGDLTKRLVVPGPLQPRAHQVAAGEFCADRRRAHRRKRRKLARPPT